jgi:hypothetical protein
MERIGTDTKIGALSGLIQFVRKSDRGKAMAIDNQAGPKSGDDIIDHAFRLDMMWPVPAIQKRLAGRGV